MVAARGREPARTAEILQTPSQSHPPDHGSGTDARVKLDMRGREGSGSTCDQSEK